MLMAATRRRCCTARRWTGTEPFRLLASALLLESQAWSPLIASWESSRFDGVLQYTTMQGTSQSLPFAATLAHVFNHSTHHRGQITAAMTGMGQPAPELDMVYMLQEQAHSSA
jgi:uncharacterized damage-inducible protein DinB